MLMTLNILQSKQAPGEILVDFAMNSDAYEFFTQAVKEGHVPNIEDTDFDVPEAAAAFLLGAFFSELEKKSLKQCARMIPNMDKAMRANAIERGCDYPYSKDFRFETCIGYIHINDAIHGFQWGVNKRKKHSRGPKYWGGVAANVLRKIIEGEGTVEQRDTEGFRIRLEATVHEEKSAA